MIIYFESEKRKKEKKIKKECNIEKSLNRIIEKLSEDNKYILLANANELYLEQWQMKY